MEFATAIPDQFVPLSSYLGQHNAFLGDVAGFYQARAVLEREFAGKLTALVRDAQKRRARKASALIVGEQPSRRDDGGAISSTDQAWARILSETEELALDRSKLGDSLDRDVVSALSTAEKRSEDSRKRHEAFHAKALAQRDKVYAARTKAKATYDDACAVVEGFRQKAELAKDERRSDKAARQYELATLDMANTKNAYIVAIAVANAAKDQFFTTDLPSMHNHLQALWNTNIALLIQALERVSALDQKYLSDSTRHQIQISQAVESIDVTADQGTYASYNTRPFTIPANITFEACPIWHDTDFLVVQDEPRTVLQNKFMRSRATLEDLKPKASSKKREVTGAVKTKDTYLAKPSLGNLSDAMESYLDISRQVITLEAEVAALQAEVDTIGKALGGDHGKGKQHAWKPSALTSRSSCSVCGHSVVGLQKHGLTCRECGLACHKACEIKMPAACGDTTATSSRADLSRTSSVISQEGKAPSLKRFSSTSTASGRPLSGVSEQSTAQFGNATAQFDYSGRSAMELSVQAGERVRYIRDEAEGWARVANAQGAEGAVPTSYLKQDATSNGVSKRASSIAPPRPSSSSTRSATKQAKAMYDYTAASPAEVTIREGDTLELTGKAIDEGWTEVTLRGQTGAVPTSYLAL
ncbi:uncharacterized protein L969DRAFT_93862 [Mixia osmundae IAM 14324]|uniref:Uncharacterized protein n=1 Tax=Mixia osmundae (strain CBS 9802 / IAM 14324 / JCM 22182 / KY 12970) TaxID=764103 RepID=G7E9T2_MIXOS|nr:uncharacterized protein L969DRAFT_93862 [Mixia osmundae IAM 14324]KEI40034.1 hypothetical protein L969DRAFT_93862 [Mixia osmundae IAM 14324]GAA99401.1 hypothetical protein E5Q_06099 [Mixia osmundae IAM 14324]